MEFIRKIVFAGFIAALVGIIARLLHLPLAMKLVLSISAIFAAYFSGRVIEFRHYKDIRKRELEKLPIPAATLPFYEKEREIQEVKMVMGDVVVSVDYFQRIAVAFRRLFGGKKYALAPLMDRARREATLRMKESCPEADAFVNCHVETTSITREVSKHTIGCVEAFSYGTAIIYKK